MTKRNEKMRKILVQFLKSFHPSGVFLLLHILSFCNELMENIFIYDWACQKPSLVKKAKPEIGSVSKRKPLYYEKYWYLSNVSVRLTERAASCENDPTMTGDKR